MLKIGELKIEIPVILAPMAGISDFPYRQIVREMGCQLVYTEMVSCKGLVYGNERSSELIDFKREDGLIAVQIFGEEAEFMARAAQIIAEQYQADIIDINMGCPTPKIVKNGSGSALMKDSRLASQIISAVVQAVDLPVTVKIRAGWDAKNRNAVEIAHLAEEKGAAAIAVHGRTREQFYSGEADWEIIKNVKDALGIPVVGNGDIFTPQDAHEMMVSTGCDGVMIARGSKGNPWLIRDTITYLASGELLPEPNYRERLKMAVFHLNQAVQYYGASNGIPKMRKHLAWYIKGLPYNTDIKDQINKISDYQKLVGVLEDYLSEITTAD